VSQPAINAVNYGLSVGDNSADYTNWNTLSGGFHISLKSNVDNANVFGYISDFKASQLTSNPNLIFIEYETNIPEMATIVSHNFFKEDNDIIWSRNIGIMKGKAHKRNKRVAGFNGGFFHSSTFSTSSTLGLTTLARVVSSMVDTQDRATFVFSPRTGLQDYQIKELDPRIEPGTLNGSNSIYEV
jgi:hypothetical protein